MEGIAVALPDAPFAQKSDETQKIAENLCVCFEDRCAD
jgi:hypothetical protein